MMLLHVLWLYIFCQRNSGMKNTHSYSWQRHVTHSDMELNIDVTAAVIRHRHTHTHTRKDICAWKKRESRKASFCCLRMLKLLVAWRQRWRPDIPSDMTALWATASLSVLHLTSCPDIATFRRFTHISRDKSVEYHYSYIIRTIFKVDPGWIKPLHQGLGLSSTPAIFGNVKDRRLVCHSEPVSSFVPVLTLGSNLTTVKDCYPKTLSSLGLKLLIPSKSFICKVVKWNRYKEENKLNGNKCALQPVWGALTLAVMLNFSSSEMINTVSLSFLMNWWWGLFLKCGFRSILFHCSYLP